MEDVKKTMGIDYDAKLVFGWILDNKQVQDKLAKLKDDSCCGRERCLCEDCLAERLPACPEGWQFVSCSPYFDCGYSDVTIALGAVFCQKSDWCQSRHVDQEQLLAILNNEALLESGLKYALSLGSSREPAKLMALPHIY